MIAIARSNGIGTPKKTIGIHFFAVLNALCIVSFFVDLRLGIVSSALIIAYVIVFFTKYSGSINKWFLVYAFTNLASVIAYAYNGRPFIVFLSAISFNLIPSFMFCIGQLLADRGNTDKALRTILDAIIFMMVVGTITYLLFPGFYYNYVGASVESYLYGLGDYRYGSYISSLALGSIGTISLVVYFRVFEQLSKWRRILYFPIIIANVVMCMQRSSWITSALALVVCIVLLFCKKKTRTAAFAIVTIIVCSGILVSATASSFLDKTRIDYYISRIASIDLTDLFNSRSYQWIDAWNVFLENPVFGLGLGSCGQKAVPYGMEVVTDGNHLRILAETGVFGFLSFAALNILAIGNSIRRKDYHLALIILLCNLAAIGSPIFDQFYSSFAYWLILGMAVSRKSFKHV